MNALRVAVVHDWLDTWRGGENVLAEILALIPSADLFALVDFLPATARARIHGRHARTSFIQSIPGARRHFRQLLPFFPRAIESLDLSAYALIVSVSHAVAKNIRVEAGQHHLCYCLTPMRYAWDLRDQYLRAIGAPGDPRRWLAHRMLDRLQRWDRRGSNGVSNFLAISRYIGSRIERAYGRKADIVYPPVDVEFFRPSGTTGERSYYLAGSRWVPYKRMDAIVAAFRALPHRSLVVTGDGPDAANVRAAAGPNVRFAGEVTREELRRLMQGARAFLFAAEEDFGIMPLEAQACGTPVIALARGGVAETIDDVRHGGTAVFFHEQEPEAIAQAVCRYEALAQPIDEEGCRRNAARFSVTRFRDAFSQHLDAASKAAASTSR
jgi:glycosyltransferase involved in cell wall biosynthesis